MLKRKRAEQVALLLLPLLVTFSLQGSLEVLHPIEENILFTAGHHDHKSEGTAGFDPADSTFGSHGPHFCSHSGAYARGVSLTSLFHVGSYRPSPFWTSETPIIHLVSNVSERGPPHLG